MNEKEFKKVWEDAFKENQQMDAETDERLRAGISRKIKTVQNFRKLYWVAAAMLIMGFGISFFVPSFNVESKTNVSQYYSSKELKREVVLQDGSKIILEPNSTLVVADDFGKSDRKINFIGKGTFDIAKDKNKPFHINAKDFTVQVLGTKFFLDQTEGKQKVDLFEGKVKINHGGKITFLLPKESWSQNVEIPLETKPTITNDSRSFSFQDETFENIIAKLEIEYNIKIEYPKEYSNRKIKGSVTGNFDEVISNLCYPFNLKPTKIADKQIELQ